MLGRITGKVTTHTFTFTATPEAPVKKLDYVKVYHRAYEWVLCQIVELETTSDATVARCHVLGYKKQGRVEPLRIPFEVNAEVFQAEDSFIADVIELGQERGAYIGKLDGKDIDVHLDLNRLLTRHVAVLAKSGSGKSYAVGVLIEEILEQKVPILVIDPHGEYGTLKEAADQEERMARFGVTPKGYEVREYGDPNEPGLVPLRLPNNLNQQELVHLIPGKLNNTQLGILYNAIRGIDELNFETLLLQLEAEESNAKWSIINLVEHLRTLGIFSSAPLAYNELLKSGRCSTVNMRGFSPEIQQIIVYKLAKDLFELRKQNKVPPFFLVVEEAHNYAPERSFGEVTSSKILRTIASEGRKFGLGLCAISQRPARVDKSVLSQCTTQLILKVTNPNDLKAVGNSVEGLTTESEREIQSLPIGTALITGVVDMPLFVNVRPRRTKHGGHAVNILEPEFFDQAEEFEEQELLPVVKPHTTKKDRELMGEEVAEELVPAYKVSCGGFQLLVDRTNGELVTDVDDYRTAKLPDLSKLDGQQLTLLQRAYKLQRFTKERIAQEANAGVEVDDGLARLEELGYLAREGDEYLITDTYVLSKLETLARRDPVAYEKVDAPELEAKHDIDEVRAMLQRFTSVKDHQECWILRHRPG